MRPAELHLTPQEMDLLLFGPADPRGSNADNASVRDAQKHLSGCAVCQSVAEKYRKADEALRSLGSWDQGASNRDGQGASDDAGSSGGSRRGPHCPPEDTWLSLAAGLLNEEEEARHRTHAAACKWCGPLLKEAMEDLAQDMTAEEQQALAHLPTASSEWQRQLATKLAAHQQTAQQKIGQQSASAKTPAAHPGSDTAHELQQRSVKARSKSGSKSSLTSGSSKSGLDTARLRWWPKLAWAAAAAILVAAGLFVWLKTREPDVNRLLAQAYTEQRTIELRMPGADYGPMRVERGGEASRMNRPAALLDAEAAIAHKMATQPENARFLQMRGRAELLEWNYDAAIETFKHALDLVPDSLTLKNDLASAYFERAEASDRAIDYGKAIDLLGQVLTKEPDNELAVFNHAIACERMFLYHDAIKDWEHYLQLDRNGPWASEARKHFEEDRRKIADHSHAEPLLNPKELANVVDISDERSWHDVDQRIDEYLDVAVREWLPELYSGIEQPENSVRPALAKLAFILKRHHKDEWLSEMIRSNGSRFLNDAIRHLAAAVQSNEKGQTDEALRNSEKAAAEFLRRNEPPGYARAQIEVMYALHRASRGKPCLVTGRDLEKDATLSRFGWISSQLMLEESVCSRLVSDQGSAEAYLKQALLLTSRHQYPGLRLRALGFSASASRLLSADQVRSWNLDREGLSTFWSGIFPLLRGYSFYQDLSFSAESQGSLELLYSLRSESAEMDAAMDDNSRHAISHMLVAKAAALTGRTEEAETEFTRATLSLALLKSGNSNSVYGLFNQIELAKLKGDLGHPQEGVDILNRIEQEVRDLQNGAVKADFFNAMGDLQAQVKNYDAAGRAFESALNIGQAGLKSFRSEMERSEWLHTLDATYRGLVRVELGLNQFEQALATWETRRIVAAPLQHGAHAKRWTKPASYESGSIPRRPDVLVGTLAALRQETIISYQLLPDGIFIWAYDNRGIAHAFQPVSRLDFEQTIRRFNEQCSTPSSDLVALRQNASKLYKWLVSPIEPKLLSDRALVIELDKGLDGIAMQALVDAGGDYLGRHYSITYSKGLFEYLDLKQRSTAIDFGSVLVVSPSVPAVAVSRGMLPTEDATHEARLISGIFPGADILLGHGATWAAVQERLKTASVFHFVGHALPGPDETSLVFPTEREGGNGDVRAAAITLPRPGRLRLVFLSACGTAAKNGEGPADPNPLVDVFLRDEVPHVIATRWNIDSAVSAQFVRSFYQQLSKGESVGSAVQDAAHSLLKQSSTQHPYYWAAFAVFGRG